MRNNSDVKTSGRKGRPQQQQHPETTIANIDINNTNTINNNNNNSVETEHNNIYRDDDSTSMITLMLNP